MIYIYHSLIRGFTSELICLQLFIAVYFTSHFKSDLFIGEIEKKIDAAKESLGI